jgi:hypothetical protein
MQVKLLAQEGELYVLAQSRDRVAKERVQLSRSRAVAVLRFGYFDT